VYLRPAENKPAEHGSQHDKQHRIGDGARVTLGFRVIVARFHIALDFADRVETDQLLGSVELFHHSIAGIDACRATHTFHLQSVADINTCRAYLHTQVTVYTVANGLLGALFPMAARFTPAVVVRDGDAPVVHQYALQPPIRAYRRTDDFTQVGKYAIKRQCKQHNGNKTAEVLADGVGHDFPKTFNTDDIREEKV